MFCVTISVYRNKEQVPTSGYGSPLLSFHSNVFYRCLQVNFRLNLLCFWTIRKYNMRSVWYLDINFVWRSVRVPLNSFKNSCIKQDLWQMKSDRWVWQVFSTLPLAGDDIVTAFHFLWTQHLTPNSMWKLRWGLSAPPWHSAPLGIMVSGCYNWRGQ